MRRHWFWSSLLAWKRAGALFNQLSTFSDLAPTQQRHILGEQLLRQVQYFGRRQDALPEWKEAASITSVAELWKIWPGLPIITKDHLRTQLTPERICKLGVRGRVDATGGSTGEPTRFVHCSDMQRAYMAASLFARLGLGWQPGMPLVCVWGSERDILKQQAWRPRLANRLINQTVIDGYRLSDGTVDRFAEAVRRKGTAAVYGFTSMLAFIAQKLIDRADDSLHGRIAAAWNGGETLDERQAELCHRAFGTPLLNYYGGRELGAMAFQPKESKPLSVLRPLVFVEVVDESGKPASPGSIGRLLWTSTACRGTPFLRYDIGDLGMCHSEDIDESGIRAIRALFGRTAGLIRLPSGDTLNCLFWNHLLKEFAEAQGFQVELLSDSTLRLLLTGQELAPSRQARLKEILGATLPGMSCEICFVTELPRTREGKLMQVIDRRPSR